jgi:hypothetical protein
MQKIREPKKTIQVPRKSAPPVQKPALAKEKNHLNVDKYWNKEHNYNEQE